ncbi:MAG: hypothetical protein QXY86_01270 [Candidatus Micrarchaeaceae archaeon]
MQELVGRLGYRRIVKETTTQYKTLQEQAELEQVNVKRQKEKAEHI